MTRSGSARASVPIAGGLLAAAALAWWITAVRMAGMNAAPGTEFGTIGWFTVTWAAMMAAMMLPSLAPAITVPGATSGMRIVSRIILFAVGYLLVWTVSGVAVYGIVAAGKHAVGLSWTSGGQWVSAGVLMLAALYELTPLKRACLARCRRPPADVRGRNGEETVWAIAGGMRAGLFCVGGSWALMAALFALGVMSLTWMGVIAALIALEKLCPKPRAAASAAAALVTMLAIAILTAPHDIPGLVVPGSSAAAPAMKAMG